MKCLLINGSPHKGNTWKLVQLIKERMKQTSGNTIEFDEIMLNLDIPLCLGCFNCIDKGEEKCPHYDQISPIVQKIKENDAVIYATSVYSLHVTALTKNFIDHMSYNFHRPSFFKKKVLVVSTAAGAGQKNCVNYVKDIFMHWGFNRGYKLGLAVFSATGFQPTKKIIEKCNKIADKFCNDILSKKYKSPSFKRVMYFNAWRAMSSMYPKDKIDNKYWKDSGLYKLTYSNDITTGFIKKLFGKMLYNFIKKSMSKNK